MSILDKNLLEHTRLFLQHGFKPEKELYGKQLKGNCVFCQKSGHFYLNSETLQWDCKSCGETGGSKIFLSKLAKVSNERFRHAPALKLARHRGLSAELMQKLGIGWNPANQTYTLPYFGTDGKLFDLRYYSLGNKVMSSKGTTAGLFGLPGLTEGVKTVYLCEGEWDAIALIQALEEAKEESTCVLGVPGAGIFKDDWTGFFRDKEVIVCYDNDTAGDNGGLKVFNKIKTITKSLRFLRWSGEKEGYDVRDLYLDKGGAGKLLLKSIHARLTEYPKGLTDTSINATKAPVPAEMVPAKEVYKAYEKWLHVPDRGVLDIIFGTVFANRFDGDPLWMFVVAPPGGTKTEYLISLSDAKGILSTTALTPASLISGASFAAGGDPSLIPKLNNKVLIVKDFTTILEMPPMVRDEIFGILRDAYDGKTEKYFGNGVYRRYESKFGILAGVTPAIDAYTDGHSALGERFLRYRLRKIEKPEDLIRRALGNNHKEVEMRKELREISSRVLLGQTSNIPDSPQDIVEKIIHLACFTSTLRGTVIREKYTNEVTFRPFAEIGTRLGKQFMKLASGIAVFRGEEQVGKYEYETIKKVAESTLSDRTNAIMRTIFLHEKSIQITEIAEKVGLPAVTVARVCENLTLLHALRKHKILGSHITAFEPTEVVKNHIIKGDIYA